MIISNYAIKNKVTILVLIVIIVIMGMWAYITIPREAAPDIKFPFIMITSFYEGASPSDMENLVTFPIERKLKSLTDVKEMKSTSTEGLSFISLEFEPGIDIENALQKVRDKVNEAKSDLPDDFKDPVIEEASADTLFPVMYVNITGNISLVRLKKIAEDMSEEIEQINGVIGAEIIGGLEREIRVEFDPDRLSAYGLTMAEIIMTVTQNNQNTPAGKIDVGDAKYSLKIPAEFVSPDEVEHLVVAMRSGKPIYISDVAVIKDTFKDRDSYSRVDNNEAVSIKVTKRSGENILQIADGIKSIIAKYRERLPGGIKLSITSDMSKEIHTMVTDLENNILTGLILVLAVIFVSLGIRNAIIVSLAIPFSMLITFFTLQALGITFNMVVLFSLILALGMLVDNAVVIVENIYRHHTRENKPIIKAAMEATSEVAWPVISSTATTVVAFVPLLYWPGIMGEFLSYLPKTVIIALTASLFVAMTINPTLAAMLIRKPKSQRGSGDKNKKEWGFIIQTYARLLKFGLRYRVLALTFFFGLLVVVIIAFAGSGLGIELFPSSEPTYILAKIETPEGTNIERRNKFALQAEKIINKYGNIENVTTSVGKEVDITIVMVDREERKDAGQDGKIYFKNSNRTMESIRSELVSNTVGAKVTVDKQEHGPPVGEPVNVQIAGDNYETLTVIAEKIKDEIKDLPGIVDLKDDAKTGLPEINIVVDKERAALLGLSAQLIGQMIKASVNGIKIANYREGEDEYDITARLPENKRENLQDILRLYVPAPDGTQVPLTSVANVITTSGLSEIQHIDQKRIVSITSNVAKGFNSQQIREQVQSIIKNGRFRLRFDDIKNVGGLINKIRNSNDSIAVKIRDNLTANSIASLNKYSENQSISNEFVSDLINAVNKVFEGSPIANEKHRITAKLSGEALMRYNRVKLSEIYPEYILAPPQPISLPQGYMITYAGENEDMAESTAFMFKAFVIAVFLVALVIVIQFNSILMTFIIMTSVILSLIGVFLGLIVTGHPFGVIMTGMGVISLAGVVVNNAIVLLDYTNLLRKRGLNCYDAIVTAGCTRFRPVMLTAITAILGLVPMAIGISYNFRELRWEFGSEMSQWWGPMSTAVIFGLAIATILTLFVVPNIYSLLFDWSFYRRREKEEKIIPEKEPIVVGENI